MTAVRFPKVKAGQWVQPVRRGYLMSCCDCALVHRMDFRVVEGRVQLKAWRAMGHTKALRKRRGIVVKASP